MMYICLDKFKELLEQLKIKKFWGSLVIEINFKDGGIVSAHSVIKEQINIK